jgi:hypothetical protein
VGFQNRVIVFIRWIFSFATHGRGARLITGTVVGSGEGQAASGAASTGSSPE